MKIHKKKEKEYKEKLKRIIRNCSDSEDSGYKLNLKKRKKCNEIFSKKVKKT